MKRELTNLEGILVMLLLIAGVFITTLCTGCASAPKPVRAYHVKEFDIVLCDHATMQDLYKGKKEVDGFCDIPNRIVYVQYSIELKDRQERPMPNLEVLGHEVWHLQELGGYWHE